MQATTRITTILDRMNQFVLKRYLFFESFNLLSKSDNSSILGRATTCTRNLRTYQSGKDEKNCDVGGDNPHLHSHIMEEQLLNPHCNQSKCSPDRYMMLNGDHDRERGLAPLLALRDKSTHMNGANSHVPFSLV
ncbi:hypothetical protein Tco_1249889 [Tanacetum coccineum]